jgi:hypothetical protein
MSKQGKSVPSGQVGKTGGHLLTGRGYNPCCPDCRAEVAALTQREALNLLVAAAAYLEKRVSKANVTRLQAACNIWLKVNRRAMRGEGRT